ncbi:phosphatase PAP2 family protein [Elizabethkingia meningoseptica]|uniref:Phosphatase PAP2 family protein n=3 Tax=Elizabethkingia meningoseptica TaxID=238 RepID=A0A1T3ICZ0_ELIME|nr:MULTISPECIES: phosphatase PAP2 family protein [Elizabethkingia]AQX05933.1 phosphoesterase [Elizabethkingia meningoseptica]AQX13471.1 phosphoesterase [Elizabethkingia meningoseptica]AQX47977.1 phosphoesterase [Elizabethkingia meningoseptica]EOR30069.1 membrane-associated phospholipid phosphatase [Elizabethkingia meningoseptica ATCC 13253 = NBRC 12535]KUY23166.1 phosphoesterase [Elizabethkingia meningoseptica]
MEEVIHSDKELLLYLNGLGSSGFDSFWISLTSPWLWIPFYLLLLFLVYKKYTVKNFLFVLLFIAIGITASDQIANVFKYGFQRLRPCHDPELVNKMRMVVCGGKYGFYSAHASTTFFLATFLSFLIGKNYKFLPYVLFIWAAVVSYSRIYLGVHFPGDVAVGALMGFLLGGLFSMLAKKYVKQKDTVKGY